MSAELVRDRIGDAQHGWRPPRRNRRPRRSRGPWCSRGPRPSRGIRKLTVGIALAVGVGRPVHRHVVDEVGDVGAVVEVEAAHQVLVGLALAGVDGDHQPGRRSPELADAVDRAQLEFLWRSPSPGWRWRPAEQVQARGGDHDLARPLAVFAGLAFGAAAGAASASGRGRGMSAPSLTAAHPGPRQGRQRRQRSAREQASRKGGRATHARVRLDSAARQTKLITVIAP